MRSCTPRPPGWSNLRQDRAELRQDPDPGRDPDGALLAEHRSRLEASERIFRRERQVVHVLPYVVPARADSPRHDLLHREHFDDPGDLLATDQRDVWWQNYGSASGRGHSGLPEPLRVPALIEISGQPLLNYLLALSLDRGRIAFGPKLNLNELYKDLLDAVWERRPRDLPDQPRSS